VSLFSLRNITQGGVSGTSTAKSMYVCVCVCGRVCVCKKVAGAVPFLGPPPADPWNRRRGSQPTLASPSGRQAAR
jgi:hypothetical protein